MPNETVTIFTLRSGKELHLDIPDWYFEYSGHLSVKTPHSTHVIYNKEEKSHRPFTQSFLCNNYLSKSPNDTASQLELNLLQIKPFNGFTEIYEVTATEAAVEKYCDSYPPVTIVETK